MYVGSSEWPNLKMIENQVNRFRLRWKTWTPRWWRRRRRKDLRSCRNLQSVWFSLEGHWEDEGYGAKNDVRNLQSTRSSAEPGRASASPSVDYQVVILFHASNKQYNAKGTVLSRLWPLCPEPWVGTHWKWCAGFGPRWCVAPPGDGDGEGLNKEERLSPGKWSRRPSEGWSQPAARQACQCLAVNTTQDRNQHWPVVLSNKDGVHHGQDLVGGKEV